MDQPQLRPIEAFPVLVSGHDVVCLRAPTDLAVNPLLVPHETPFMLAHFDGKHLILDIQEAYARQYGQWHLSDVIKALIVRLDEGQLLDAEEFFRSIAEPHDRRRMSGLTPTDMLLSTMPTSAGIVLKYDQAVEPATQSRVSYASVVFS
jgi:hypothetical protein